MKLYEVVVLYQIANTVKMRTSLRERGRDEREDHIQNASEVLQVALANTVVVPLVSKLKPFQKKVIPIGNLK